MFAISKMENLLSQSQDNLIHGLDFSVSSNTASYVESRSEVTWFPSGNYFSPNGVRTIRVSVSGNSFIDLYYLLLVGNLHNDVPNHNLKPLTCGIHGMIDIFGVYVNGAKCGDQIGYGRLYEHMTRCMPSNVRRNLATTSGFMADESPNSGKGWLPDQLVGGSVLNWLHKPITNGICNCGKYMPLQFLGQGLILEWELGPMTSGISTPTDFSNE